MKTFLTLSTSLTLCVCLSLGFVTASAKEKLSESEAIALHDKAMDILGSAECRNKFRAYLKIPLRKAFAYTVDPRGYYGLCDASYDKKGPKKSALRMCNKARNKSKYIKKFSPKCKIFASDNTLLASMADFKLKPHKVNLSFATQRRTLKTIKQMVSDGADVNQINSIGSTPLFSAVKENRQDVAEYLIGQGADVKYKTKKGYSPLHTAVIFGNTDIFFYLLSQGADKNLSYGDMEKKFIHYAGENGNEKILKHLISLGEDINTPDKYGNTALHHAVDSTNLKAVKLLVRLGANIKARTKSGKTPLDYTKRKKKLKIRDYLISQGATK